MVEQYSVTKRVAEQLVVVVAAVVAVAVAVVVVVVVLRSKGREADRVQHRRVRAERVSCVTTWRLLVLCAAARP